MERPQRQHTRLTSYDYSTPGAYFVTICTQNRKPILSKINVGTGVLDCPKPVLTEFGEIADRFIKQLNAFYDNISVDNYVIMPDHIHLLLSIHSDFSGQSGTPVPTDNGFNNRNSIIAKFVSTFKRFCNKEYGHNIWQERYFDHIVRNQADYTETWKYIDDNPAKWLRQHNKPSFNKEGQYGGNY